MNGSELRRFTSAYIVVGDCWEWQGGAHPYGRMSTGGRQRESYVISYEHFVGQVPPGKELDHLCRNPRCVRPDHLEAVTHKENCLRGMAPHIIAHRERRCTKGHSVEGSNAAPHGPGKVICRICQQERDRNTYRRATGISLNRPVGRWVA